MPLKKGEFIPAIVKRLTRYSFKYGWHGRYQTWAQALKQTTGYHAGTVLQRVSAAALQVKNGQAVYERDGIALNHTTGTARVL
jgi:hypothetical protein